MSTTIKQEFKLRNFGLNYEHPYHFYTSTIEKPTHFHLVWRIFWFLFHCGGILAMFLRRNSFNMARILAFATVWGYLLLTVTMLVDLIFVILFKYVWSSSYQETHQNKMPWYFKASWFISNVAYDSSWIITAGYWILLYNGRSPFLGLNIMEHALNSVYTFLNMFICNKPIRLLHFWHVILSMMGYIAFLGIYYSAGGVSLSGRHYIYPFMDFRKPAKVAIYAVCMVIACLVIHVFNFLLYRARLWLSQKFLQREEDISSSKRDLKIVT